MRTLSCIKRLKSFADSQNLLETATTSTLPGASQRSDTSFVGVRRHYERKEQRQRQHGLRLPPGTHLAGTVDRRQVLRRAYAVRRSAGRALEHRQGALEALLDRELRSWHGRHRQERHHGRESRRQTARDLPDHRGRGRLRLLRLRHPLRSRKVARNQPAPGPEQADERRGDGTALRTPLGTTPHQRNSTRRCGVFIFI